MKRDGGHDVDRGAAQLGPPAVDQQVGEGHRDVRHAGLLGGENGVSKQAVMDPERHHLRKGERVAGAVDAAGVGRQVRPDRRAAATATVAIVVQQRSAAAVAERGCTPLNKFPPNWRSCQVGLAHDARCGIDEVDCSLKHVCHRIARSDLSHTEVFRA